MLQLLIAFNGPKKNSIHFNINTTITGGYFAAIDVVQLAERNWGSTLGQGRSSWGEFWNLTKCTGAFLPKIFSHNSDLRAFDVVKLTTHHWETYIFPNGSQKQSIIKHFFFKKMRWVLVFACAFYGVSQSRESVVTSSNGNSMATPLSNSKSIQTTTPSWGAFLKSWPLLPSQIVTLSATLLTLVPPEWQLSALLCNKWFSVFSNNLRHHLI